MTSAGPSYQQNKTASRSILFHEHLCDVKLCASRLGDSEKDGIHFAVYASEKEGAVNKEDDKETEAKTEGSKEEEEVVPASRALLAGVSPVFHRLFFGDCPQSEKVPHGYGADAPVVRLDGVSTREIRAIVHYCHTNEVVPDIQGGANSFKKRGSSTEEDVRMYVKLLVAAHRFEMKCLQHALFLKIATELEAHWKAKRFFMAAVLFDATMPPFVRAVDNGLHRALLRLIACHPLEILHGNIEPLENKEKEDGSGLAGVTRLSLPALKEVLGDPLVLASEMTLFQILQEWVACNAANCMLGGDADNKRKACDTSKDENPSPTKKQACSLPHDCPTDSEREMVNEEDLPLEGVGNAAILRDLIGCIDLSRLKPSVLNDGVLRENHGVKEAELLMAFKRQVEAVEEYADTQHTFYSAWRRQGVEWLNRNRSLVMFVGADISGVNSLYATRPNSLGDVDVFTSDFCGRRGSMRLMEKTNSNASHSQSWCIEFTEDGQEAGTGTNIYRGEGDHLPESEWIVDPSFAKKYNDSEESDGGHLTPICIVLDMPGRTRSES